MIKGSRKRQKHHHSQGSFTHWALEAALIGWMAEVGRKTVGERTFNWVRFVVRLRNGKENRDECYGRMVRTVCWEKDYVQHYIAKIVSENRIPIFLVVCGYCRTTFAKPESIHTSQFLKDILYNVNILPRSRAILSRLIPRSSKGLSISSPVFLFFF